MTHKQIEIVAIQGSVRPGNYTGKALALVVDEMGKREDVQVQVFDPAKMTLSFPGQDSDAGDAAQFKAAVARASGVVLSTPEYHGSHSSVIKMMIENLGFPSALSGKPVAIKSLESLRSICAHVGSIVLPGPVSISGVQQVFDEAGRCLDAPIEARLRTLGQELLNYIGKIN